MKIHMLAPLPDDEEGQFGSSHSKARKPAHRSARPGRGILKNGRSSHVDETDHISVLIPAFVAGAAAGYLLWRVAGSWIG